MSHKSTRQRALSRVATAGVLVALLALAGCTAPTPNTSTSADTKNANRVLQAVSISMRPDGTATAVTTSNVFTLPGSGGTAKTATSSDTFNPRKVVNDLPVRVLTSWSAGGKTGTNLADLAGHTGPVEIDLTVENLTGTTRELNYNVAGTEQKRSARVSVPLTVAASTTLAGVDPSQVTVSSPTQAATAATNGVVSPSGTGSNSSTVVQWATILAPPQLSASASLRLVLNAHNLVVPAFDLTIEPGISTDPSISGVVATSLDGSGASNTQLLARTVQLVADVNTVLGQASSTITQVATNLDSTGHTLGVQTASDLHASTTAIAEAMTSLSNQASQLGTDLSSSLNSTQSSLVATLQATVNAATNALGDTTQTVPPPTVNGANCSATLSTVQPGSSLYSTLQQVAGQLAAYAHIDQGCKTEIQQSLTTMVGTLTPDAASCTGVTSLSCAVYTAETSFGSIADDLEQAGQRAIAALDPALNASIAKDYATLSEQVDAVQTALQDVSVNGFTDQSAAITDLRLTLAAAQADSAALSKTILEVNRQAQEALKANADVQTTAGNLTGQVCGLIADGTLTADRGDALLSYLTSIPSAGQPDCTLTDPAVTPNPGTYSVAGNAATPLDTRLSDQEDQLRDIIQATAASASDPYTADMLTALNTDLASLNTQLVDSGDLVTDNSNNQAALTRLSTALTALTPTVTTLVNYRNMLTPQMTTLAAQQANLSSTVTGAFTNAAGQVRTQADQTTTGQLKLLNSKLNAGVGTLNTAFGNSTNSLLTASGTIQTGGAAVVAEQEKAIEDTASKAGVFISNQVSSNLNQIATSVTGSTQNLTAASTLLTADLNAILLDLGTQATGTGLLGSIATSSATANAANSQLAQATQTATTYANARSQDMAGIQLQAAQTQAALQAQADLPLFHLNLPVTIDHRSIYTFHIGAEK